MRNKDDYRTGCRNVIHCHQQQSYSGQRSPGRSNSTYFYNVCVMNIIFQVVEKREEPACCVSILVHLLLYLTLHLVGKLPKLSICYLSCWLKRNPPTKYYWTIWHTSCKNLTVQLYKLDNWVVEIKHLSCRIQNCREYRHNEGCIILYHISEDIVSVSSDRFDRSVIRCSRCM